MFYTYYSFFYFGMGVLFTFLSVYFVQETPLKSEQVTLMMSFVPIISFISSNFFAYLSDRTRKYKTILITTLILTMASALLLAQTAGTELVIVVIGAYCLFSFFMPAPGNLTENFTLQYAKEKKIPYGRIRLFGSLGYAIAGQVAGYLTNQFGLTIIFYIFAICLFIPMLFVPRFPDIDVSEEHESLQEETGNFRQLFKNRKFTTILLCSFFILAALQVTNIFFGIYIIKYAHLDLAFLGMMTLISAGTEIPMMYLSNTLIEKFGVYKILALAACLNALRFVAYFMFPVSWVIILVTLTHGIGYGSAFTAIMHLIERDVPAKMRASAISMNTTLAIGLGNFLISSLGSLLHNEQLIYLFLGLLEAVGFFVCLYLARKDPHVQPVLETSKPN